MANDVETILKIVANTQRVPILVKTEAGREYLVYPNGADSMTYEDVTEANGVAPLPNPHIVQEVKVNTVNAISDYVNRYSTDDTVIFGDITQDKIVAILDYHSAARESRFTTHRAIYGLPVSQEWKLWTSISGTLMSQLEFARFLEENAPDITNPSAADIREAIRDIQAVRKVSFKKVVRTSSDNESFEYSDDTNLEKRGAVEVPTQFTIRIPIYFGGQHYDIGAWLRWKLDEENGGLKLGLVLSRHQNIKQSAFSDILSSIELNTGVPVFEGFHSAH